MDRYVKNKTKTSYLYIGLGFAAAALVMIVMSVLSAVHGEKMSVLVTGFAAGIVWGFAAFVSLRVYYKSNRSELSLLESPDQTDKK